MFSTVLGLFSQDLAVDLGTSRTRVYLRGTGVIRDLPTCLTIAHGPDGERAVDAIGEPALAMVGRTPAHLDAIHPVRAGQIEDFECAEAFLLHLVREIHGRNTLMRPKMAVSVPWDASPMAVRAIRESCEFAGARDISLVPRSIAAAIGTGLSIHPAEGTLIVDLGAGSTEASILSLNRVVHGVRAPGGIDMDQAIISAIRERHGLVIGAPTAERVKLALASAVAPTTASEVQVGGRCADTGLPRAARVQASTVHAAIHPLLCEIGAGIQTLLESVPSELASDVVEQGVLLTGGVALLPGIESALREATGLPTVVADEPTRAVVQGLGAVIETHDLLRAVAS